MLGRAVLVVDQRRRTRSSKVVRHVETPPIRPDSALEGHNTITSNGSRREPVTTPVGHVASLVPVIKYGNKMSMTMACKVPAAGYM